MSAPDLAAWQPLLWPDADDTAPGPFAPWPTAARRELGNGAWVDQVPGWLRTPDALFDRLRVAVPWRDERRRMYDSVVAVPRRSAWYGDASRVPDPVVAECRDELNRRYAPAGADPLVSAGLCLYRDGADSVAWHGDRIGRGAHSDTIVAVLSLGSARPFLLRPAGGGPSIRLTVGHGDLLVMGGSCQRTWEHAVPKTRGLVGPRISVQFRPAGVA